MRWRTRGARRLYRYDHALGVDRQSCAWRQGPAPDASTAAAAARFLGPKEDKHLWDEYIKGLKEVTALEEQANKTQTDFNEANSKALQDSKFQLDTIGLASVEIQKLTLARKMDLAAIEAEGKVIEGPFSEQFRAIVEEAKAAKKASLDLFDAIREKSRSWETGTKTAFNDYIDHATNAADRQTSFSPTLFAIWRTAWSNSCARASWTSGVSRFCDREFDPYPGSAGARRLCKLSGLGKSIRHRGGRAWP